MIKQIIISLLFTSLASFSSASFASGDLVNNGFYGGDLVNNGGGLAEKNILVAYYRLERSIDLCLSSIACKINDQQAAILTKIRAGLAQERMSIKQIQFGSEKAKPGSFQIDGEIKVARTGNRIASPILINLDLLYVKNEDGFYVPMTTAEATAMLVHELGHHYGNYTHSELDLIGIRVAALLQQKIYTTPLLPWSPEISVQVINDAVTGKFPEILLSIGNTVVDLSREYEKLVKCPVLTIPIPIGGIPDIDIVTKEPEASTFHNIAWEKFKEAGKGGLFVIQGNISNKCKDKINPFYRFNDFKMSIRFRAYKENGVWQLENKSLELVQNRDPWWKLIQLPF